VKFIELLFLLIFAFLPPLIYVIWIRNTEIYNREKWIPILLCFIWGASISVIAALILEIILHISLVPYLNNSPINLIILILIAPFVEELTKPLAFTIKRVKKELDEIEDGLIYGAVAGLGFSATENLLYGYVYGRDYLSESLILFLVFMALRSFGGCLLHASATAWTGYGYSRVILKHKTFLFVMPYFLFAVFVHAVYNSLLTFDIVGASFGLFTALLLTFFSINFVRKKIIILDKKSGGRK
jgi:RsiW-degrading membrane proteinase PrsW (M82 family)